MYNLQIFPCNVCILLRNFDCEKRKEEKNKHIKEYETKIYNSI